MPILIVEQLMPCYYFDVHDGVSVRDDTGMDLPNQQTAADRATHIAGQFVLKPGMPSDEGGAVVVEVFDTSRTLIKTVRLVFTIENHK